MNKPALRCELRASLRGLASRERADASASIRHTLLRRPALREARCLAVYDPLPGEPDVEPLREALPDARFAFPRREEKTLAFYLVENSSRLRQADGFRFREPDPSRCPRIELPEIDVLLVPGLAFTPTGSARLGQGGGWYDRLLAEPALRAARLGVCFAFQLRDNLPTEPHDRGVDSVITENSG